MLSTLAGTQVLDQLVFWLGSVPLDAWAARDAVYPSRGNGFAAAILGALVGLGVLIVVMIFISSKPKNRRR